MLSAMNALQAMSQAAAESFTDPRLDVTVLHADDALLVVNKPAGLLAVPGRGESRRDCVAARVQAKYADALIVHRLDQATSGLMVLARGAAAQRALSMAFEQRRVAKHYLAVVAGVPQEDHGEIALPLCCDWPNRPRQQVDTGPRGKPSLTRWTRLGAAPDGRSSRLALEPVTGRSHQLRVHLAAIGHAIVGDTLYAPPAWQAASARLLLHADRLSLAHPASGADMTFECDAPF
jgi:tRNA pseudouridine32 synthase/23S rRNA pseudouridine746 synthase